MKFNKRVAFRRLLTQFAIVCKIPNYVLNLLLFVDLVSQCFGVWVGGEKVRRQRVLGVRV